MKWYEDLVSEFFSQHIRSTKNGREEAEEAFKNSLRAVGTKVLLSSLMGLMDDVEDDVVAWRVNALPYTVKDMKAHLAASTPEGVQFASDLLSVARDMIIRAANKS